MESEFGCEKSTTKFDAGKQIETERVVIEVPQPLSHLC